VVRGLEIDWVLVRVNTVRRLVAVALTAPLAAALLIYAYTRLHLPPEARARRAVERAERAEGRLEGSPVPDSWRGEMEQARHQLEQARTAYADERWPEALSLAGGARQRFETLAGAGKREVVGEGQIVSLEGSVSVQRAGESDWISAHERTPVFNGDFVKTGSDGSAEILFADGSLYRIAPNSLLEIHQQKRRASGRGGKVHIRLGRVNVYTSSSPSTVSTDAVETEVQRDSRVAVKVTDRDDTVVAAYSGVARVKNPRGEVVTLSSRERVSADGGGGFGAKGKIPKAPTLYHPRNNETFNLERAPIVELMWRLDANAASSHLEVSRSKRFLQRLLQVDAPGLTESSARLRAIAPGTYYWRVAAVDEDSLLSEWSSVHRFQVVSSTRRSILEDTTPPELSVEPARQMGHLFIVEGQTEVGAVVTVNGEAVEVDGTGHFQKAVEVTVEGWNELVVAAVDPSGNTKEHRQRVYVEVY